MKNDTNQLNFLHSLDFPNRSVLYLREIAERLGGTMQHYLNLVDTGELTILDTASYVKNKSSRRMIRVPIESYRNFILQRLSSEMRPQFLANLPPSTLIEIQKEINKITKGK